MTNGGDRRDRGYHDKQSSG
jgi:hypothetical protein